MINDIKHTFIIAELSANHNNDFDLAARTVKAIAETGADAVKVQTYTADSLTMNVDNELFGPRTEGLWKGRRPYELFEEASMPYEWQPELKKIAEENGLVFFSSPFDLEGVDFLEKMDVPIYKVASLEITDIPLIEYIASKGKPVIISTGAAGLADIELAVNTCRKAGNNDIYLLKCTSEYPAPVEKANLNTIPNLKATFNTGVGVSDHTMGAVVPITAVALGATIVEKHFILDRKLGGPDSAFSMEPEEFKAMVEGVRQAEAALGKVDYYITDKTKLRRRSVFVSNDIAEGELLSEANLKIVRPGNGIHPAEFKTVIGKKASRNLKKGDPLSYGDFI